jgi:hypothetical protein
MYQQPNKRFSAGNMQADGTFYPRRPPLFVLGAFAKLRKANISFMSGCPSVHPHGTTQTSCPFCSFVRVRVCVCVYIYIYIYLTYVYTRHSTAETQLTSDIVGKASRLRTGWSRARIPVEARIFPLLHNVQTGSWALQCVPKFFTGGQAVGT